LVPSNRSQVVPKHLGQGKDSEIGRLDRDIKMESDKRGSRELPCRISVTNLVLLPAIPLRVAKLWQDFARPAIHLVDGLVAAVLETKR
jgi:hypothetical protein